MPDVNIVVDIDNTLADTQSALLEYVARMSGGRIPSVIVRKELRGDGVEWYEPYVRRFIESTNYQTTVLGIKPYATSIEAMEVLSTLGNVHIVSSRINNWHDATYEWLRLHNFQKYIQGVYLRDINERSVNFKKRIATEIKADYLFDDSLDIVLELGSSVRTSYLINQIWNTDFFIEPVKTVIRCDNLLEAAKHLSGGISRKEDDTREIFKL